MHQMGSTPPQSLPPQALPPQSIPPQMPGNPPSEAIHGAPPEFLQQQMPPATQPAALPWTIGSTDGSFAMVTLMQQQQQFNWNGSSTPQAGAPVDGQATRNMAALGQIQSGKSLYHDKLFHQASSTTESVLAASCDVMGFDIAEMWLRTGPKTHQLTNSHLRPTALEDSVRNELVDVYYGDKSSERTHRLSPALCKRAKDANDVVWVTAHTPHGAEALRCSISNVRTAVAIPVCHEASNSNITIVYFSIRR